MSGESVGFWILSLISVFSAIMMIVTKNPVRSALNLVITFLCVAVFYILMSAQFLAAVQVIVYAGAIMVLFLFVIMLLNLGSPEALIEKGTIQKPIAVGLGIFFVVLLIWSQALITLPQAESRAEVTQFQGTVEAIGLSLFNPKLPWLFPFEITSILLLVAVIGAIVMAKRKV